MTLAIFTTQIILGLLIATPIGSGLRYYRPGAAPWDDPAWDESGDCE